MHRLKAVVLCCDYVADVRDGAIPGKIFRCFKSVADILYHYALCCPLRSKCEMRHITPKEMPECTACFYFSSLTSCVSTKSPVKSHTDPFFYCYSVTIQKKEHAHPDHITQANIILDEILARFPFGSKGVVPRSGKLLKNKGVFNCILPRQKFLRSLLIILDEVQDQLAQFLQ